MIGPGAAMAGAVSPDQAAEAAGSGQAPQGGGAAAGTSMAGPVSDYMASMGPNTPQTPQDMLAAASNIAQQLLGLPEGVKDSELRKLHQQNEVLHSLVRSEMDKIRQDARMQGGAMVMQGAM
jgi:hypothetical protein